MKKITLFALSLLVLANIAQARGREYGMAGCGLGSVFFKNDPSMVMQVISATTNGTSASQTFGITSGTSNCTDDGAIAKAKQIPMFIEANQVALANDIARGNGEALESLSKVMGCNDSEKLSGVLKSNYNSIYSNDNIKSNQVTTSIMKTVKQDQSLSKDCSTSI